MKARTFLVITAVGAAACTFGGTTVSLGGRLSAVSGGASALGGAASEGPAGTAGAPATGGGLNVHSDPVDVVCPDGEKTTISGTVYDPAGVVPLYNAVVYIPNVPGELPPFPPLVGCEKCTEPVSAKTATLSGPDGHFILEGVPVGDVEVVVQLGKWRRKQTIPVKNACQDNPLTAHDLTRLPRTHAEGNIPKIALSTGHSDALECLLRKIGIDDSEFTTDAGSGQINLYVGCVGDDSNPRFGANKFAARLGGADFPSTNHLFDSGKLDQYDVVIFSCEGHKCDTIQTPDNIAQLVDFENRGGRVFLDHDHYNWLKQANAPIESAASFSNSTGVTIPSPLSTQIDTSFPKGDAFAQWLLNVQASTKLGALDIYAAKTSVQGPLSANRAQRWIYRSDAPLGSFYFTIGTPVAVKDSDPPPEACGRVVFTDLHISKNGGGDPTNSDFSDQDTPFPGGCTTSALSAQEKALEFMLFDLTSCVQQESALPTPPQVVK